jgi:predicted TIM-barrel fold metal-dependent hydrolase
MSGKMALDLGDTKGMARRFDRATHAAESAGWNVEKVVNVAAAVGVHSVDETLALEERADAPDAIVGGLPPADTVTEAIALIERQMAASRFRGVRPMGQQAGPLPPADVLRALAERDLLFELMARTDQLEAAAHGLADIEGLTVVVEHAGWPRTGSAEELALWKPGIDALAALGDHVHCKLSGLAMPLGSMAVDAFAPWIEHVISAFGVDRCLFASNFPVDGLHGTLDQLFTTYDTLTAGLDEASRTQLWATNAERLYRC